MTDGREPLLQARQAGIVCAIAATSLGVAYMFAADAPFRYLGINAGALALGLATFALLAHVPPSRLQSGALVLAGGVALMATAMFGIRVEGAARWVGFGPLTLQISMVVLPAMILAFAKRQDALSTIGIGLAAVALALQPDRAMAGVLAASLAVLAASKTSRATLLAFVVAGLAFGESLLRPDALPAVPYVDRILYSAFDVHLLAGLAVVAGACLLVAPAAIGWSRAGEHTHVHLAFGVVWASIVIAAALGNYPTPVVGYGGSAILGYLISLSLLPRAAASNALASARSGQALGHTAKGEEQLRVQPT